MLLQSGSFFGKNPSYSFVKYKFKIIIPTELLEGGYYERKY